MGGPDPSIIGMTAYGFTGYLLPALIAFGEIITMHQLIGRLHNKHLDLQPTLLKRYMCVSNQIILFDNMILLIYKDK